MFAKINNLLAPERLTRARVTCAMIIAVVADGLQFWLGPLGWLGAVQVIDVVAMILTTLLIGFHLLLLPTFVLEFIPLVDMMPTWTGCVIAVIALRRRGQAFNSPPVIEVDAVPGGAVPPRINADHPQNPPPQLPPASGA